MIKKRIKVLTTVFIRYEVFILIGFIITVGAFIKLLGICDFSSDWFWFFVGVGLVFDRKYKIVEK